MKYKSEEYLTALSERLETYIPNLFADPPEGTPRKEVAKIRRRQAQLFKMYDEKCSPNKELDIYDLQLAAQALTRDIGISQLLGENEIVVPHFVAEYKRLKSLLALLNNEYKRLNQFPEIKEAITPFKVKEISSLLYDDLTQLCTEYNIECDIKELVKSI